MDVEEYFQVSAFEPHVPRADWSVLESRVVASVHKLLALLERHGAHGTFFILGWVAERHPLLVKAIADAGHEVASHGWDHRRVTEQTPAELRESVRSTKAVLESIVGVPVIGFRAPSFSIVPGREWALDVLIEEGYEYDSSLFPITRPGYGYPAGARDPHVLSTPAGSLVELPPTTLRRAGFNLPAAGGGYFRLLPYVLPQTAFRDCATAGRRGDVLRSPVGSGSGPAATSRVLVCPETPLRWADAYHAAARAPVDRVPVQLRTRDRHRDAPARREPSLTITGRAIYGFTR